jgi:phosphatidylglycerol:prolipoprotein diacylglycerol transferase
MGRVPIYSYPAMLYLGIVFGIEAQLSAARFVGLNLPRTLSATLILLTTALLGARLLFVMTNWHEYREQPHRIWRFSDGGASMYGGLLLAFPVSFPVLVALDVPLGAFWDTASFTMLVGLIFTRIGCFLNGCCAGRPTSRWFGLTLPDDKGVWRRRVPVQFLEAAWGIVVLAGAVALWSHLAFQGALFIYAIGAYGAARGVLEPARENQDRVMGVSLHRAISTAFLALSLAAFAAWWR